MKCYVFQWYESFIYDVLRIEIHLMISLFSKTDCDTICSLHSLMNSVDHKTASQKRE